MKKLKCLLAVVLSLVLFGGPLMFAGENAIYAKEQLDLDEKGSLTLVVRDNNKDPVPGGSVTIYHVASITQENGEAFWTLTPEFEKSNANLSNPESRYVVAYLEDWTKRHDVPGRTQNIPANGVTTFTDMPLGLYLVVQNEAAPGYKAMTSFLISVPAVNKDGTYEYDVYAFPKADPVKKDEPPYTPDEPDEPNTPNIPDKPSTYNPPNNTTTTTTTTTTTNRIIENTTTKDQVINRTKASTNTAQETNFMQWTGIALISGLFLFLFVTGSKKRTKKS